MRAGCALVQVMERREICTGHLAGVTTAIAAMRKVRVVQQGKLTIRQREDIHFDEPAHRHLRRSWMAARLLGGNCLRTALGGVMNYP